MTTIIKSNKVVAKFLSNTELVGKKVSTVLNVDSNNVITLNELLTLLLTLNVNSLLISIFYFNDHSGSRSIQGKKAIQKLSYQRFFIGHNYENKVNVRLEKQFEAEKKEAILNGTLEDFNKKFEKFEARKANGLQKINNVLYQNPKNDLYRLRGYLGHENNNGVEMVSTDKTLALFNQKLEEIAFDDAVKNNLFTPSYISNLDKKYISGRGSLNNDDNFKVKNFNLECISKIAIQGKVYNVVS